jgi:hypothetical protein
VCQVLESVWVVYTEPARACAGVVSRVSFPQPPEESSGRWILITHTVLPASIGVLPGMEYFRLWQVVHGVDWQG